MGYYDGLGLTTTRVSTWETAQKTASPTVLVKTQRRGTVRSLAAVVGLQFQPQSGTAASSSTAARPLSYAPLPKSSKRVSAYQRP